MASKFLTRALVALPVIVGVLYYQFFAPPVSTVSVQCLALQWRLGEKVSFPGSDLYEHSRQSYWSQQQQSLTPKCVMKPVSVDDVSTALKTISMFSKLSSALGLAHCPIAIKGGGHTPWEGSSNVNDGVTFDMGGMRDIVLTEDKSIVSVGGGARWIDVYETLDSEYLSVSGGRVASVGVAGLTLGGE